MPRDLTLTMVDYNITECGLWSGLKMPKPEKLITKYVNGILWSEF